MSEEVTPSTTEGAPETTPATTAEPPSDFREYVKWRQTGALPATEGAQPATAVVEPQVKTEPQSGADGSQQTGEEDEEEDKPRSNGRVRRIDRLTRENEQLKQQLASFQQPRPAPPPAPPEPAEPPGKPRLHDFATLEAYQEALTDWKLDQREIAKRAEAERTAAETAAQKIQSDWQSTQDAARTAHPDYDEVVQSVRAPEGPGVPAMRQAMLEDESGGEILYYLATHADDMKRIAALPPVSAVKEIGKLAARLGKPSGAGNPKPHVSGAPKPPPSLSRPSANPQRDDIHDENVARDFKRWNSARVAQLKG